MGKQIEGEPTISHSSRAKPLFGTLRRRFPFRHRVDQLERLAQEIGTGEIDFIAPRVRHKVVDDGNGESHFGIDYEDEVTRAQLRKGLLQYPELIKDLWSGKRHALVRPNAGKVTVTILTAAVATATIGLLLYEKNRNYEDARKALERVGINRRVLMWHVFQEKVRMLAGRKRPPLV